MRDETTIDSADSGQPDAGGAPTGHPAGTRGGRLRSVAAALHLSRGPDANPFLALGVGAVLFVLGAAASSLIDKSVASVIPDAEIEAARVQQALIADRTDSIGQGVQQLQARIDALASKPASADLAALSAEAQTVLAQMREVTPLLQDAALRNAALTANLRAAELARAGASPSAALVLPDNSSATVCGDFTIGVRRHDETGAWFALSRRGQTDEDLLRSGQSVALEQSDAAASVSFAGIRGTDPQLYGIDFNCYSVAQAG